MKTKNLSTYIMETEWKDRERDDASKKKEKKSYAYVPTKSVIQNSVVLTFRENVQLFKFGVNPRLEFPQVPNLYK